MRRDRGEHPPDERVDDLHGRDVDDDARGAGRDDALGQVLLQRAAPIWSCRSIWIETSRMSPILRIGTRSIRLRARAAAADDLDAAVPQRVQQRVGEAWPWSAMSPNSMPSATIVCAICGRMPEMMHSAPISRAATTVLSRCWATWVSTAGTPVMSMIACCEPVSTRVCSSFSITTWVRAESRVPTSGTATTPSQSLTTGVDSSRSCSACSVITCSRALANSLERVEAELVDPARHGDDRLLGVAARVGDGEQRLLEREDVGGGLGGAEAAAGAVARHLGQHRARGRVGLGPDVQPGHVQRGRRARPADHDRPARARLRVNRPCSDGRGDIDPAVEQLLLAAAHQRVHLLRLVSHATSRGPFGPRTLCHRSGARSRPGSPPRVLLQGVPEL